LYGLVLVSLPANPLIEDKEEPIESQSPVVILHLSSIYVTSSVHGKIQVGFVEPNFVLIILIVSIAD